MTAPGGDNQAPKSKPGPPSVATPERLAVIAELLTRCFTPAQIESSLAKEWQVSERSVRKYIRKVRQAWADQGVVASRDERAFSRVRNKAALEKIVADVMGKEKRGTDDMMVAIRALRELNAMDGHHTKRFEVTGAGGGPIQHQLSAQQMADFTDDELDLLDRSAQKAQRLLAATSTVPK